MSLTQEHLKLMECEELISKGLEKMESGSIDVGFGLGVISEARLYRDEGFTDFATYCRERWDVSKSYAYRLMSAAEVVAELSPIGDSPPTTEGQVRPLVKLDPDQRAEAWARAIGRADELGKAKPTAVIVAEVVGEMTNPPPVVETSPAIDDNAPVPERRPQSNSHPATFSEVILAKIRTLLDGEGVRCILDPFAGVGTIHQLASDERRTIGIELEREWADTHADTICGDARNLLSLTEGVAVDAVVTSPAYGNRMADKHNARDESDRMTYKHRLGRDLTDGNAGGMQWGEDYRALHADVWTAAASKLIPGGVFVLNVKDHIRNNRRQYVSAWHVSFLERECGLRLDATEEVVDAGLRHAGENVDKRIGVEMVYRFRKA